MRKQKFGTGGASLAPPGAIPAPQGMGTPSGDPGDIIRQKLAAAPPKDQVKIKKLLKEQIKKATKGKSKAPAIPMPPAPPPGAGGAPIPPAPPPGMRIGGAVRGVGIARKGGGRGKIV